MKEMTSDINAIKILNKFIKENSKRYLKANVLPEIKPHIIKPIMIKFSKTEQAFYDTLRDYCKSRIGKAQERIENKFDKTLDKVMAGMILVFILRLKQCANDPNSILKTMKRLNDCYTLPEATAYLLECKENPESECNVCFDKIADYYAIECHHQCCAECWERLTKNGVITCPHCRQIVTEVVKKADIDKKPKELILPETDVISSKIKAILNIINELVEKGEKVVVTSIFLDTLAEIKKHCNFEFIDITGSIPIKKRFENIEKFKNNDTIKICYLSLLAGSEGINLVSASNLILCDLYWNMAKLTQVYDRINRIGQKKQTYIYKVNVAGTIEKSLQKMINKKEKLSDMLLKNINQEKNYEEEMVMIEDKIEFF
jgi:SNF2 family DNA or RNA helicase